MLNTQIIGKRIVDARKKINISQSQLAEHLFISSQAVGKWERGESMPDIITLNRLAEILGVDLNYFSENFQSANTATTSDEPNENQPADKQFLCENQQKKPNWNMSNGNWVDADFSGLKNLHERFSSSNMQRCLFIGSNLSGLLLKGNNIESCDFSGSDFSKSHIQGSNLVKNVFKDCSLKETEFSGSHILGCDFTETDFTGVTFKSGGFEKNTMANAVLNQTSFIGMYIADLVFEGTLNDCSFDNCAFSKLTFQNATLTNTFFKGRSLKRIKFVDCKVDKITYAFLKNGKADMTGIALLEP